MSDRKTSTPGPANVAQVRKDGENWTLVLVKDLRHPENVWRTLTDPAHLREWSPFDASGDLGKVGTVNVTWAGSPTPSETRVTRADPPKLLQYTSAGNAMRWERRSAASRVPKRCSSTGGNDSTRSTPNSSVRNERAALGPSASARPSHRRGRHLLARRCRRLCVHHLWAARASANWRRGFRVAALGWSPVEFSAMTLNMFLPPYADPAEDHGVIESAVEQSIYLAELGYNPWFTDHHFRGPWHSNPMQLAAYIAPQIPRARYIGFGALSIPFYHPVRLIESINLMDHLTKGNVIFGVGSGWQGTEPESLGVAGEYHSSGKFAEDMLDVMDRLWSIEYGDPPVEFSIGPYNGVVKRRIMPAPYTLPHPTLIRAASREASLVRAAEKGWPAFLGIFGADLREQADLYRRALASANHPADVVENCLRWCSVDWMSVTVAETDAEAKAREERAKAESLRMRGAFIARNGEVNGPVINPTPGKTTATAYAAGGDMTASIAGSPATVAERVQQVVDAGVNHLHLRFAGEWLGETRDVLKQSAELFARDVMPRFAGTAHSETLLTR